MLVRPFQESDAEVLRDIFKQQGLDVHLPLPNEDPCVIAAMIGVEGDRIVGAVIQRLTSESHLIIAPDEPQAIHKIKRLADFAAGAVQTTSTRLKQLGFASVDDTMAFVPRRMTKMHSVMVKYLGFIEAPHDERGPTFIEFYKKLGN